MTLMCIRAGDWDGRTDRAADERNAFFVEFFLKAGHANDEDLFSLGKLHY
jgi:hypothetical protein